MIEQEIDLATADGAMNTFITHPEEGGPHPPVLFYMDAPGKREELHDMARRIATAGYFVMLPNLYYRLTREFQMDFSDEGMKEMFANMRTLRNGMIVEDTKALLAHIDGDPAAKPGPVGVVGYCMSGPFAVSVAAAFPDRVTASASIYGAGLVTQHDDSPHKVASKIKGEMYFACAEIDAYAPRETIDELGTALAETGINYRIEWYPGVEHGFAFPKRKGIYDKPAAERHWERLFAMFARNL